MISSQERHRPDPLWLAWCLAVLVLQPWLAAAVLVRPAVRLRVRRVRRRQARDAAGDGHLLARVVLVGLAGGLPLPASLEVASRLVGGLVAGEVVQVMRNARRSGMAAALTATAGAHTSPLFRRLAIAQASGAPMVEAVAAHLAESRAIRRGEALARVRRLPVALMIPLGLLILPGFVVLFVGPIILRSIGELAGSMP